MVYPRKYLWLSAFLLLLPLMSAQSTSSQYLASIWGASPTQIWAVGNEDSKTLVKLWSGTSWSDIPAPSPGTSAGLLGVGGTASNDAWVVGTYSNGSSLGTLTEHWNGSNWQVVPSPNPVSGAEAVTIGRVLPLIRVIRSPRVTLHPDISS